jgi:hypothetical protein
VPETQPATEPAGSVPPPEVADLELPYADNGSRWGLLAIVAAMVIIGIGAFLSTRGGGIDTDRVAAVADGSGSGVPKSSTTVKRSSRTTTTLTSTSSSDPSSSSTDTTLDPNASTTLPTVPATTTPGAPAAPAAKLTIFTPTVDFGSVKSTVTATIGNSGGQNMSWNLVPAIGSVQAAPQSGTLAPGANVTVTLTLVRGMTPEGSLNSSVAVQTSGGNGSIGVKAVVGRAPAIQSISMNTDTVWLHTSCGPTSAFVTAIVLDEAGVNVKMIVTTGSGGGEVPMAAGPNHTFTGQLGPYAHKVPVKFVVVATDVYGNQSTSGDKTLKVEFCR